MGLGRAAGLGYSAAATTGFRRAFRLSGITWTKRIRASCLTWSMLLSAKSFNFAATCFECGEVAEWSIASHSKCEVRASVPGVRIPPSPPPYAKASGGRPPKGSRVQDDLPKLTQCGSAGRLDQLMWYVYFIELSNCAFAPFARPTPQSDSWRHDRSRIVSCAETAPTRTRGGRSRVHRPASVG